MPRSYYDDNYGHWEGMDDPDMQEFYQETQRNSIRKKCHGCGRMVKIRRDYGYCNSCCEKLERGGDL